MKTDSIENIVRRLVREHVLTADETVSILGERKNADTIFEEA